MINARETQGHMYVLVCIDSRVSIAASRQAQLTNAREMQLY